MDVRSIDADSISGVINKAVKFYYLLNGKRLEIGCYCVET